MKHTFLLDIMVIYHAIKGVDEDERPDRTATELVRLIRENCHTVVADKVLSDRYSYHLKKLFRHPALLSETVNFFIDIILNSDKFVVDRADAPQLPAGVKIPREDEYVARAALIRHPFVVTAERQLLKAINSQHAVLGLTALSPAEALERARETGSSQTLPRKP